jgi:rubrerythrin
MVATAQEEGNRRAEISMRNAMEVEKVHHGLFNQALEAVNAGADMEQAPIRVCPICGHTVIGDAPDECPVCKAKGSKFLLID